eukprot:13125295-Heterocapsa_arctica.AAC.1
MPKPALTFSCTCGRAPPRVGIHPEEERDAADVADEERDVAGAGLGRERPLGSQEVAGRPSLRRLALSRRSARAARRDQPDQTARCPASPLWRHGSGNEPAPESHGAELVTSSASAQGGLRAEVAGPQGPPVPKQARSSIAVPHPRPLRSSRTVAQPARGGFAQRCLEQRPAAAVSRAGRSTPLRPWPAGCAG